MRILFNYFINKTRYFILFLLFMFFDINNRDAMYKNSYYTVKLNPVIQKKCYFLQFFFLNAGNMYYINKNTLSFNTNQLIFINLNTKIEKNNFTMRFY